MSDFLADMTNRSHDRLAALLSTTSRDALTAAALASAPPLPLRRIASSFIAIAEVKRASPSLGVLAPGPETDAVAFVVNQATAYARHGAAAVSVLTEPSAFGGDLEHARVAARELRPLGVPVMRKDFLVDPAQVYESRLAGCSGVLIIIRMLKDDVLRAMLEAARACDLFVLLEAFDEQDLARARTVLAHAPHARVATSQATNPSSPPPVLVGLNTRDLETLAVNPHALSLSSDHFPPGFLRIAESGMHTPQDVRAAAALGYQGVLVGTSLMRSGDPGALLDAMIAAGSEPIALVVTSSPPSAAPSRTRVKVCGLSSNAHVDAAIDAGADAIGLVMVESPRRVGLLFVTETRRRLPVFVQLVLVHRDDAILDPELSDVSPALIRTTYQRDSAAALRHSSPVLDACTIPVLRFGTTSFQSDLAACAPRFHTLLIEGPRSGVGEAVDWHAIAPIARAYRVILAGGLTPDNVGEAIRIVRPFAVDVSSGVESAPGIKDPSKIAAFLNAVRAADAAIATPS